MSLLAVSLLAASPAGCGTDPAPFTARGWDEADRLFRTESDFLGADAAYSVPLAPGRTLFLFGDTFVATSPARVRSESRMVRNTVGIVEGADPSTATFTPILPCDPDGVPQSFFAERGDAWLWPMHGARIEGGPLILFLSRVVSDPGGLGFRADGAVAVAIDDPDADPIQWTPRDLALPDPPFPLLFGVATLIEGEHLYVYAVREPGNHDIYLVRYPLADARRGDLAAPEWWVEGERFGDVEAGALRVMDDGATELSVSAHDGRFVAVQTRGFGGTTIATRSAPRPEGPWTALVDAYRPPESDRDGVIVYAAKAHPELSGADLVVTYAANDLDFASLVADASLYFPRFVRLDAR